MFLTGRRDSVGAVVRAIVSAALPLLLLALAPAARAANPIQAENALPGTTSWQARSGGDVALYASQIGAAPGGEIDFHVSTENRYRIVVYRLGWYGGAGARLVSCLPACEGDEQGRPQPVPAPPDLPPALAPPIRAGWPVTDVLHTDPEWTSGYYLAEAVLTSGPDAGRVATTFFVLREPASQRGSRILVQVPVNTWEAYNRWGGKSLYDFYGPRAYRVSFERPFGDMAQPPMWWEIQLVRFLEREGADVSYQTDVDTDREQSSLLRHRLVMVAGHDEYWTLRIRDAFDAALAAGTNLAFMGSNEAYWHIEYEDGGTTIFGYKSLYDPNPTLAQKTALFREIGRPECMLMGVQHQSLAVLPHALDYTVTAAGAADPWLARSGFRAGDTVVGVVGREHDVINPYPESCFHPGLTVLFHYDGAGVDQNGDAVRFTAPSGARVFASGAQQFAWGLDDWRSDGTLFPEPPIRPWVGVPVDPRLQQFMRSALDDLTRPAAPAGLSARAADGRLQVAITPGADPRVRRFVAAVRRGRRWTRLCHGVSRCTAPLPPGAGPITVGAVAVDVWRRHSAAAFAVARRQP
ncbi:MAG: hypothetical protein V7644_1630 [Actinomycetota bacterium]